MQNGLFTKGNECHCPELVLSTDFVLEAGTCSVTWIRKLHNMNKDKLISSIRMSKNVAYIDNLIKKVSHALTFFSIEMTMALEFEYGNEAKGTWSLLRMLNDYVMQLLLTVSISKGNKVKDSMVFSFPDDIHLKLFRDISMWL